MTIQPGSSPPGPSADDRTGPARSTASQLQSMLSRAVEDQASEQRELTASIGDMREQLVRLGHEIAELRVRPPHDDATDAQLNVVAVEMREAVRLLGERLDGVTRMVAQRGAELGDIRAALEGAIALLTKESGSRAMVVAERLTSIEATLGSLPAATASVEIPAFDPATIEATLAAAFTPVATRLDVLSATTAAHSTSLAQLHARLGPIQTDLTAIGGNLQGIVDAPPEPDNRELSESMTAEIRAMEQRLRAHVEESLVALAEIVLRRRTSSVASPLTVPAEPVAEPAPASPPPVAARPVDAAPEQGALSPELTAPPTPETPTGIAPAPPAPAAVPAAHPPVMAEADRGQSVRRAERAEPESQGPADWSVAELAGLAGNDEAPVSSQVEQEVDPIDPPCITAVLSGPTQPAPDAPWKPQTPPQRASNGASSDLEQKRRWGRHR